MYEVKEAPEKKEEIDIGGVLLCFKDITGMPLFRGQMHTFQKLFNSTLEELIENEYVKQRV